MVESKVTREDMDGPDPLDVAANITGLTPLQYMQDLKRVIDSEDLNTKLRGIQEERNVMGWGKAQKVDLGGDVMIQVLKFGYNKDDSATE